VSDSVVVSQRGARMHYAVARIFNEANELERLYTDICAARGWPRALAGLPGRLLPKSLRRLAGRVPTGIPRERIRCFEAVGLTSVLGIMLDARRATETAVAIRAARDFSAGVVRNGFGAAGGFYGISGECLEQLEAARAQGLWTAVEQIIAPRASVDRLVAAEADRFPDWEPTIEDDLLSGAYAAREIAEWKAADIIICPSEFVRDGIGEAGGPTEKCVVVPYGIDTGFRLQPRLPHPERPLHVLTVGAVGLRKGAPYVLEAARRMGKEANFRMVGPCFVAQPRHDELRAALDLRGAVPRTEIMDHYAWADVFLLPSVCEGSATVVYEALAAGLPVVTTPNAGSVVRNSVDGFIVEPGDIDAICRSLRLLNEDRALLEAMSRQACETATDYDLAAYGKRLRAALTPIRDRHKQAARANGMMAAQ
jgi:glycosyltransferase involved in cell wall biosynthesis